MAANRRSEFWERPQPRKVSRRLLAIPLIPLIVVTGIMALPYLSTGIPGIIGPNQSGITRADSNYLNDTSVAQSPTASTLTAIATGYTTTFVTATTSTVTSTNTVTQYATPVTSTVTTTAYASTTVTTAENASTTMIVNNGWTYLIYTDGTYYYAINGYSHGISFGGPMNIGSASGRNATQVAQDALNSFTQTGGVLLIDQGVYIPNVLTVRTSNTTITGPPICVTYSAPSNGRGQAAVYGINVTASAESITNLMFSYLYTHFIGLNSGSQTISNVYLNCVQINRQTTSEGLVTTGTGSIDQFTISQNTWFDTAPYEAGHGMITWNNSVGGRMYVNDSYVNEQSVSSNSVYFQDNSRAGQALYTGDQFVTGSGYTTTFFNVTGSNLNQVAIKGGLMEFHETTNIVDIINAHELQFVVESGTTVDVEAGTTTLLVNDQCYAGLSSSYNSYFIFVGNHFINPTGVVALPTETTCTGTTFGPRFVADIEGNVGLNPLNQLSDFINNGATPTVGLAGTTTTWSADKAYIVVGVPLTVACSSTSKAAITEEDGAGNIIQNVSLSNAGYTFQSVPLGYKLVTNYVAPTCSVYGA